MHVKIEGQNQAEQACKNWLSPRFYQLDQLERYVLGTQYDGRPNFYEPHFDCPLIDRAPNVVHSLTEAAIRQHTDFALGDGRFPEITSASSDDEELLEEGLDEADSDTLDAFLRVLMDHAEYGTAAADALADSEGCGTAVSVVSVVDGCPEITSLRAKWCEPMFDKRGRTVERLEVRYPFVRLEQGADKVWRAKPYLYRRVIDAESDTVYHPAEIGQRAIEPSWRVDQDRTVAHGLGFCPVVWYQFKSTAQRAADFDGRAIHASQLDELDALNITLSQRNRAALYAGDPQAWEAGVDKDDPAGGVTHVGIKPAAGGYVFGSEHGRRTARRKGAGVVWSYESPQAKVGLLALPGDALDSIDLNCKDLEDKIGQVLGYTKTTPESVKGALSGKALGFLFARTTAFVDTVRADFWRGWMQPTLHMLLRAVKTLGEAVYVPGVAKALPILKSSQREGVPWTAPRLRAFWPKYFEPTAEEIGAEVKAAVDAKDGGLICKETAVRYVAQRFGVENVEAELEKIEEEAEEHDRVVLEQNMARAEAAAPVPGEQATPDPMAPKTPKEDNE